MTKSWSDYLGLTVADRYLLRDFIGEDQQGAAFSTQTESSSHLLIRIKPADATDAVSQLDRWTFASGLEHPNLLPVYTAGQSTLGGMPVVFAVTERPDDNLAQALSQRALSAGEARDVLNAILPALQYLHNKGIRHGRVEAGSILAVGDRVKLSSDFVSPVDDKTKVQSDINGIGAVIVEMLTQQRLSPDRHRELIGAAARLETPFREVALHCLRRNNGPAWTPAEALAALDAPERVPLEDTPAVAAVPVAAVPTVAAPRVSATQPVVSTAEPEVAAPRTRNYSRLLAIAAGVVVLLLLGARWVRRSSPPEPTVSSRPVGVQPEDLPSAFGDQPAAVEKSRTEYAPPTAKPKPAPAPERTATAAKPATPTPAAPKAEPTRSATAAGGPGWAVVAAIYRDYDAAERRARTMGSRFSEFKPSVFPPKGEGKRYLVVLGSGLSKGEADTLRSRATRAGLPRDTYVTKLSAP